MSLLTLALDSLTDRVMTACTFIDGRPYMAVFLASRSWSSLPLIVFKNDSTAHDRKVLYFLLRAERELFTLYLLMG